ncbi:MAG TPA: ribonuclease III [Chitinophagales bacterium]|jgi:ribonuclease-3|nr:ribonuclease III [Chitinophagales bacterium]
MLSFLRNLFPFKKQATPSYEFVRIYENLGLYPRADEQNYIQALTHSSFTKKLEERNERLEFLGDAVINFAVAEMLYYQLPGKDEGTLTKARASIVNRKNLNKKGMEIGIPEFLRHKLTDKQLEDAPDIIGNAFEALIGAYFLDYGMQKTGDMVLQLLLKDFDPATFNKHSYDPKSFLIEWVQARKKSIAFDHNMSQNEAGVFFVSLKIDGEERATGTGKNKKEAEHQACARAVKAMELNA